MHLLSTLVAIAAVTCCHHVSASSIFFQASPTTIYPVLTKSLKLRCSVEVEPGPNLALRRYVTGISNSTTTGRPPTQASSTTHTVPHLAFNTTHSTRTTASSTSHRPTIPHADVSHVMSIIVSRRDRVTGKLQTVARVSAYDPASASVDPDNIKVAGDTESSPIPREKGYLELTWEYPAEGQSAEYFCDIYGLDASLHPVSLAAQIRVVSSQVTLSELAGFVAQNQRYVTELQASLANVTAELSQLQAESRAEIRALNDTIDNLQNRTENLKAQNVQTGTVSCLNTYVSFPKPYERNPIVFISIFDMQTSGSSYNWNLAVTIQNLNTTGFTPFCTRTSIISNNIRWIAIDD